MTKFLTDVHTHSKYSFDGQSELSEMLRVACEKGIAFYGVSEHFDYDAYFATGAPYGIGTDEEAYFHGARRLQEDYAGCMNVLVGAEFGYSDDPRVHAEYQRIVRERAPDFIVNSTHTLRGVDYYTRKPFGERAPRDKSETYGEYLSTIRRSLEAPYPYDIVGHIGYITRYAPYPDRRLTLAEFGAQIDDILQTVIGKNKILEVNSSNKGGEEPMLPSAEILQRYYELGGRNVSFASDAHGTERIGEHRERIVEILRKIGFTHVVVPCRGEYIEVEI